MTVDERLDRLTERHEALTQTIELLHRDWEARWADMSAALQQDAENIRGLARIAEIHERRITHLKGGTE